MRLNLYRTWACFVASALLLSVGPVVAAKYLKVTPEGKASKASTIVVTVGKPGGGTDTITVPIAKDDDEFEKARKIIEAVEAYGETRPGAKDGPYDGSRMKNKRGADTNSVKIKRADGQDVPSGSARIVDDTCEKMRYALQTARGGPFDLDLRWHGTATGVDPEGIGPSFVTVVVGIGNGSSVRGDATMVLAPGTSLASIHATLGAEIANELAGTGLHVTHDATGIHVVGLPSAATDFADDLSQGFLYVDWSDAGLGHAVETREMGWDETFDGYAAGSQIVGQGGWEAWQGGTGALVSNARSRSGGRSVDVAGATDIVQRFRGHTRGTWDVRAWQYVPSSLTGRSWFILLNTYAPGGPYGWSVQVAFDGATGMLSADAGSTRPVRMPYVPDRWVELRVVIDLDEDWTQVFYDGRLLDDPLLADHPTYGGGHAWSRGVFGNASGAREIAALDLYSSSATSVHYDDLSLHGYLDTLRCQRPEMIAGAGGAAEFLLQGTASNAGRFYVLVGTFRGTSPGLLLPGGAVLPINWDPMTDLTLQLSNLGPFQGFSGFLDATGRASARLSLPPEPRLAGFSVSLAYALIDPPSFDFTSRPVTLPMR